MSGAGAGGAPRAAAVLALLALAQGAGPRGEPPRACPRPWRLPPAEGLPRVACGPQPAGAAAPAGAARLLFGLRLDPNRATARALDALPGIGPARAEAIVREARLRPFCAPEDLERVPGIGPATRSRLAGWIETRAGACRE